MKREEFATEDRWLSPVSSSWISGISPEMLRYYLREGLLPGKRFGRAWRIKESDLRRFMEAGQPRVRRGHPPAAAAAQEEAL